MFVNMEDAAIARRCKRGAKRRERKRLKIKEKLDQWISAAMVVASRNHVAEKMTP